LAPGEPPDGKTPMDAKRNDMAIPLTGGPNNLPTVVLSPRVNAMLEAADSMAMFPHMSVGLMREDESNLVDLFLSLDWRNAKCGLW